MTKAPIEGRPHRSLPRLRKRATHKRETHANVSSRVFLRCRMINGCRRPRDQAVLPATLRRMGDSPWHWRIWHMRLKNTRLKIGLLAAAALAVLASSSRADDSDKFLIRGDAA